MSNETTTPSEKKSAGKDVNQRQIVLHTIDLARSASNKLVEVASSECFDNKDVEQIRDANLKTYRIAMDCGLAIAETRVRDLPASAVQAIGRDLDTYNVRQQLEAAIEFPVKEFVIAIIRLLLIFLPIPGPIKAIIETILTLIEDSQKAGQLGAKAA